MAVKQHLAILGSTGSVGVNTLDVVSRHPEAFRVVAQTARNQTDLLYEQCCKFNPQFAVMLDPSAAADLERRIRRSGIDCAVLCGPDGLEHAASLPRVDTVMAAIVGIAGLRPTLAAARAGKRVLLANKESLVTAGPLLTEAVQRNGATLLPIDSEHNAIFQALPQGYSGKPDA